MFMWRLSWFTISNRTIGVQIFRNELFFSTVHNTNMSPNGKGKQGLVRICFWRCVFCIHSVVYEKKKQRRP